jgi:hypothetical protein
MYGPVDRAVTTAKATAAVKARQITEPVFRSIGAAQSKIDSFKTAFPSGVTSMTPSSLMSLGLSPTGIAGKFMSVANLKAYNLEQSSTLSGLGTQLGQLRETRFASMKSQVTSKAETAKSQISSSLMSHLPV